MQFDANGWLDAATEIDYSANSMSRQAEHIKYIVLHATAGGSSAQGVGQYFQSTVGSANPVSSHLIIDQDGNLVQGVPLSLAAFGNGIITQGHASYLPDPSINPNFYTASIEFVKASTDNSDAITPIQAQVGFQVIACICDTYPVPRQPGDAQGGIIQHADIDPISRARCPGPFPFNDLFTYLKGATTMTAIPTGWIDNGTILRATNGVPVTNGFRNWVLSHNWDPANVPLRAAESRNPLERANPGLGAGTRQVFLFGIVLEWTPSKGVFLAWSGQELLALEQALAAVPANITQLASQAETVLTQLQQHVSLVSADIVSAQTLLKNATP